MKKKICYIVTISMTIKAFFIPQLQYLAKNGFDVTVICSADDELQNLLGEKIRFIPVEIPRGLSIGGSLRTISVLKKIFKREKFDLIQYSTPNAAFYASIAGKATRIKVRNYHLMGFRYLGAHGFGRKILKFIEKRACKKSTHIECVSASNLALGVKEKVFKREKAVVVWNGSSGGIDLTRFNNDKAKRWREEKRCEYDFDVDTFTYGFVGRITRDKGVVELINAYENVRKKNEKCKLVFIGDFDENHGLPQGLEEKIKRGENILHISQRADIEKYYPMLDVLVLPSYREGFGNVVIEAQAMGVPVIVSNIPGPIDAMREGETGLIVSKQDVEALTQAMEKARSFREKGFDENAIRFARDSFDSNALCCHILQRKSFLLNNGN